MFKKFYTTKSNRNGTGLGLSIVAKYVEVLNGSIKFESELSGFIAIMAKKPLQELFDFMTLRMKEIMNA